SSARWPSPSTTRFCRRTWVRSGTKAAPRMRWIWRFEAGAPSTSSSAPTCATFSRRTTRTRAPPPRPWASRAARSTASSAKAEARALRAKRVQRPRRRQARSGRFRDRAGSLDGALGRTALDPVAVDVRNVVEELARVLALRSLRHLIRRALLDDLALVHDEDLVGDVVG